MVDAARRGDLDVLWSSGGNFLDVLPAPDVTRTALERAPLRVHQDIVLTHQMLVEPGEIVVLLPAATRYEQEGGGTSTTTERRVAFSPEIPGRASARRAASGRSSPTSHGACGPTLADTFGCEHRRRRSAPRSRASCPPTPASRHCTRPATRSRSAASVCARAACSRPPTARRASRVVAPQRPRQFPTGQFVLSTRRGKQFNSMVWSEIDPLTGCRARRAVRRRATTRAALGVDRGRRGGRALARTASCARACTSPPIRPGNVQAFFPEANPLLAPARPRAAVGRARLQRASSRSSRSR